MRIRRLVLAAALPLSLVFAAPAAGSGEPALPQVGSEFPDFTLPDVRGAAVSLGDFRGKAIMLSFWSCHTDTCFTTARVLAGLLERYGPEGLVAPTVCSEIPRSLRENEYEGLLARCGLGQVILVDKNMRLAERLGVTTFPTTFLIDRNHVVWNVVAGVPQLMSEEFGALVRSLVTEE